MRRRPTLEVALVVFFVLVVGAAVGVIAAVSAPSTIVSAPAPRAERNVPSIHAHASTAHDDLLVGAESAESLLAGTRSNASADPSDAHTNGGRNGDGDGDGDERDATTEPVAYTPDTDIELLRMLIDGLPDGHANRQTLRLENRTYSLDEPLRISWRRNIAIIGGANTELIATHGGDVVTVHGGERIHLESLSIRHLDEPCIGACLKVIATRGAVCKDLTLNGCGAIGLEAEHCENLRVEGCQLFNNSWLGLRMTDCNNVTLSGNRLYDNYRTADLKRVTGLTSANNENEGQAWSP